MTTTLPRLPRAAPAPETVLAPALAAAIVVVAALLVAPAGEALAQLPEMAP